MGLHAHYRPAPHVLDRLSQVDFVAVVGPTASGKTTLIKRAMAIEPLVHRVLSTTSRAPRPGERHGVDFHFLSKDDMQQRIGRGEYAEVAPTVFGDLYAAAPEDFVAEGVAVLEVLAAAVPAFRSLPFKSMRTICVVPPGWATWQRRIQAHQFTPGQLARRMAEAGRSLGFALGDDQTQFVINGRLQQATDDVITLAFGNPQPPRLQADQTRAPALIRSLSERLQG